MHARIVGIFLRLLLTKRKLQIGDDDAEGVYHFSPPCKLPRGGFDGVLYLARKDHTLAESDPPADQNSDSS
jgi:hypothetical protein